MADKTWKTKLLGFLRNHHTLAVLLIFLPVGFIFNMILQLRKKIYKTLIKSSESHEDHVAKIQAEVKLWNDQPKDKRKLLCTARPNWMSLSTKFFRKDLCHKINVDLFDILDLDEKNMTVRVEPLVTIEEISDYLIPMGYSLAVTIEIADATLGGLALATGMTTRSHKVGLFHESVVSYEVILGDGSLITASANENSDLYKALPFSHGSLGLLVGLTLKIVKIKPYIKLNYLPVKGQKNYCDMIRLLSGDVSPDTPNAEFIEATIFSHDKAVIMTADYSDYDPGLSVNHVARWYKPWFYKHTETFLTKGKHTELVPLKHYLLRHNRSIFWVAETMIPFGNNFLFRLLFGWLLPLKPAFLKFSTTPELREYTVTKQVFQDIVLPIRELENQINICDKLFDTYPLLVYPCRIYSRGPKSGQIRNPKKEHIVGETNCAIYNDLGIYGVPGYIKRKEKYNSVDAMIEMEKFTIAKRGFSFLYADIFMTRAEFEEMFDLTLYEEVRKKYHASETFPHLYDKVKPEIDVRSLRET